MISYKSEIQSKSKLESFLVGEKLWNQCDNIKPKIMA